MKLPEIHVHIHHDDELETVRRLLHTVITNQETIMAHEQEIIAGLDELKAELAGAKQRLENIAGDIAGLKTKLDNALSHEMSPELRTVLEEAKRAAAELNAQAAAVDDATPAE